MALCNFTFLSPGDNYVVIKCFCCCRIPLIPRRTLSPDGGTKSKMEKSKALKNVPKDNTATDDSSRSQDIDEKLLTDAHTASQSAVDKIVSLPW